MYYYCLTPPNFQSKYVFDEKFQQNYYLSKICSIFGKRRPTDFFRSMTGREYSLGKIKQAASTKRKTRKKDTRGFVFQMYCKFYSVYLEHFSSSINILFLQSGFFYYVFKLPLLLEVKNVLFDSWRRGYQIFNLNHCSTHSPTAKKLTVKTVH